MTDLRVPEKENYVFDGWYYDEEFKQPVSSEDKLTQNTTVYAKFIEMNSARAFWKRVGNFFAKWWWCFVVGAGVIVLAVTVTVIEKKKKR